MESSEDAHDSRELLSLRAENEAIIRENEELRSSLVVITNQYSKALKLSTVSDSETIEQQKEIIAELEESLIQLGDEIDAVGLSSIEKDAKISALQLELDNASRIQLSDRSMWGKRSTDSERKILAQNQKLERLMQERETLQADIALFRNEYRIIDQQLNNRDSVIMDLKLQIDELMRENDRLSHQLNKIGSETSAARDSEEKADGPDFEIEDRISSTVLESHLQSGITKVGHTKITNCVAVDFEHKDEHDRKLAISGTPAAADVEHVQLQNDKKECDQRQHNHKNEISSGPLLSDLCQSSARTPTPEVIHHASSRLRSCTQENALESSEEFHEEVTILSSIARGDAVQTRNIVVRAKDTSPLMDAELREGLHRTAEKQHLSEKSDAKGERNHGVRMDISSLRTIIREERGCEELRNERRRRFARLTAAYGDGEREGEGRHQGSDDCTPWRGGAQTRESSGGAAQELESPVRVERVRYKYNNSANKGGSASSGANSRSSSRGTIDHEGRSRAAQVSLADDESLDLPPFVPPAQSLAAIPGMLRSGRRSTKIGSPCTDSLSHGTNYSNVSNIQRSRGGSYMQRTSLSAGRDTNRDDEGHETLTRAESSVSAETPPSARERVGGGSSGEKNSRYTSPRRFDNEKSRGFHSSFDSESLEYAGEPASEDSTTAALEGGRGGGRVGGVAKEGAFFGRHARSSSVSTSAYHLPPPLAPPPPPSQAPVYTSGYAFKSNMSSRSDSALEASHASEAETADVYSTGRPTVPAREKIFQTPRRSALERNASSESES